MLDGSGMVYVDSEKRTVYANALELDWEESDGNPMFAVAYLGKTENAVEKMDAFIKEIFKSLTDIELDSVQHFDLGGEEWYLVVPGYNEYVDITNTETSETYTVYHGEAFTVNCHSGAEISTESHGGHKYTLCADGEGMLILSGDVCDITDYQMMNNNIPNAQSEVMMADYFRSEPEGGHYELVLMCPEEENGEKSTRLDVYNKQDSASKETVTSYKAEYTAVTECRAVAESYGFDLWDERADTFAEDGVRIVCKYFSESGETVRVSNECMPENGREGMEKIRIILEGFINEENRIS